MAEFTITLSTENEQQLQKLAARSGRSPQDLLKFYIDRWLEFEAATDAPAETQTQNQPVVELAPGEYLAPEGIFPDDGCTYTFVERSSNPRCAEDYMTPEQRFDVLADILSTIALRIVKEKHRQKDWENKGEALEEGEVIPQGAKPKRRTKSKNREWLNRIRCIVLPCLIAVE